MRNLLKTTVVSLMLLVGSSLMAQQSVLLVGGGARPEKGLEKWLETSPAKQRRVMIITWASKDKKPDYEKSITADLQKQGVQNFLYSRDITNAQEKEQFLKDLPQATHIFFSGGSQNKIMAILNDADVMEAVQKAYWQRNIPVAGTSAGTSAQAELMITGDEKTPLAKGLGFIPKTVIDQHFFKRDRVKRLRGFMHQAPSDFQGIGVDEDGSILFQKDPKTKKFKGVVYGDKNVMFIGQKTNLRREEALMRPAMCKKLF